MEKCRKCHSVAEVFVPKGGGWGVRCTQCGAALWHPTNTREGAIRIWNWRQKGGEA